MGKWEFHKKYSWNKSDKGLHILFMIAYYHPTANCILFIHTLFYKLVIRHEFVYIFYYFVFSETTISYY